MKRVSEAVLQGIGSEVRRRRGVAGFSLNELAERAELSMTYLSRFEQGHVDFSISVLWSIAVALDCEPAELFPSTKSSIPPGVLATARLLLEADPAVRDAMRTLLELTPSARER
jgi:transcriptional regulator with XRE-family HTH domain